MRCAPLVALAVFLAIAAAWLMHESGRGWGLAGSSLARGERGASLARAYLAGEPGRSVGTLDRPLSPATAPATATVFRLEPQDDATVDETRKKPEALTAEERAWVVGGGRLVIAIAGAWRGLHTTPAAAAQAAVPLLPGVRSLGAVRGVVGDMLDDAIPAFVTADRPAVSRLRLGHGEVWFLGCPEALENVGLAQGDHLALLVALAGSGRPVLFDERSTGAAGAGGVTTVLLGWGLGGTLAIGALVVLVLAWRRAVVPGPDSAPADPPQRGAVDGVPAVAALYERAMTPAACLGLHHRRLLRAAAARHGGPAAGKAALERLLPRWRQPSGNDPTTFRAALRRLNHAFRSLRDEHPNRRP
jgi:hypothetical protein